MLCVISPAKSLFSGARCLQVTKTVPEFIRQADYLSELVKDLKASDFKKLFDVSQEIAERCEAEYRDYKPCADVDDKCNLIQAGALFDGPAYRGLDCMSMNQDELYRCNTHVRFLSGLYGLLRPSDLIQRHRLEMGTKGLPLLENVKNLYTYWGETLAEAINKHFLGCEEGILLNCASEEYFKVIPVEQLDERISIIKCIFLDQSKVKSVYAKKARGLMARFVSIDTLIHEILASHSTSTGDKNKKAVLLSALRRFNLDGYEYDADKSTDETLVFNRSSPVTYKSTSAPAKGAKRKSTVL